MLEIPRKVGWVGIGSMGRHMLNHTISKGALEDVSVGVFARRRELLQEFDQRGAFIAESKRENSTSH